MVYGAQEVLGTVVEGPASAGYGILTGGLVALAVTLHLFVLFSGEFNRFAQGYLVYAGHDGVLALRQWALARSWRGSVTSPVSGKNARCDPAGVAAAGGEAGAPDAGAAAAQSSPPIAATRRFTHSMLSPVA